MSSYELTISSGAFSVSGYPSPTGTFISAVNGSRVPVALLAVGTMVFTENGNTLALKETLKGNVLMECGLLNGGRVAVLSKMDSVRLNEISKMGTVVHFSS